MGSTLSSCLEPTLNIVKKITSPLPPPSMDSSLLVGDYLFVSQQDSTTSPAPLPLDVE